MFQETLGDILKVGVNPKRDADYLFNGHGIRVEGTFDLRFMGAGFWPEGLKKMANKYLDADLETEHDFEFHLHWEHPTLDEEHIDYAAQDVFQSVELFKFFGQKLENEGFFETKSSYVQHIIECHCNQYLDLKYSSVKAQVKEYERQQPQQTGDNGMVFFSAVVLIAGGILLGYVARNITR